MNNSTITFASFFLIVAILIGAGALLMEYIYTGEELAETQTILAQRDAELAVVKPENARLADENTILSANNDTLMADMASLDQDNHELTSVNTKLQEQLALAVTEIEMLQSENALLTGYLQTSREKVLTLSNYNALLADGNQSLENQVSELTAYAQTYCRTSQENTNASYDVGNKLSGLVENSWVVLLTTLGLVFFASAPKVQVLFRKDQQNVIRKELPHHNKQNLN